MKKILLIGLMAVLCSCQKSNQERAEQLVKNYLAASLSDPQSYEVVRFEPISKQSKPGEKEQTGWQIVHAYKAKNRQGALGTHSSLFQIDPDLTTVTNIQNLDK